MQRWNSLGLLDVLRERDPLLLTDLQRDSVLSDPEAAAVVESGRERDGSSQGGVYVSRLDWHTHDDSVHVTMGAIAVRGLHQLMEGRALFDRPSYLSGPEHRITFEPGDAFGWTADEDVLALTMPRTAAEALLELRAERGDYTWPALPGLHLTIEPTEVTDRDGNVVETIG
jgi:hypothetical protein